MLVWAFEGMTAAAERILNEAGHTVCRDASWYPLVYGRENPPFVVWSRMSPFWGRFHPDVVSWRPVLVATPCTGSDHCDTSRARGVKVLSLRDCGDLSGIRATVEMTLGLIIALTRRIPSAVESVRRGEWDRMRYQGTDLLGKTAAVVGIGRIGWAIKDILLTLGVYCLSVDPQLGTVLPLIEILPQCDLVTVHADLNETSRGMFGPEQFAAMKPGAYFVNTSRGGVLDEGALLESLRSGHIAGAALDVFCTEPLPADSPLLAFAREQPERLLLTPHLGGCSRESMEKAEVLLARKLCEVLADA